MDASNLSRAIIAFRDHMIQAAPEGVLDHVDMFIGHPAQVAELINAANNELNLVLFIYHIEHAGYPVHAKSDETSFVKMHCLLTAMTKLSQGSTGEMDLKLLGHVMETLHRNPLVSVRDDQGAIITQLQVVPTQTSMEDLARIFSTQFETSYRVSIAYELSMVPVFTAATQSGPLVEKIDLGMSPDMMDRNRLPEDPASKFETLCLPREGYRS